MVDAEALSRVRALVQAARRLGDPEDPLGREARACLPTSTGLSPEGVDLALRLHLETQPSEAELHALIGGVGSSARCHVLLSANVFTAPLRALALAWATARVVQVRASRREPHFTRLLLRALEEGAPRGEASLELVPLLDVRVGEEVHAYGRDATLEALRAQLPDGALLRAHGTGFGVAVAGALEGVGSGEGVEVTASKLSEDLIAFDQRGCLSPRVVLVEGGVERAAALGESLHRALDEAERRVPRGRLLPEEEAELLRWRSAQEATGEVWVGPGHLVALDVGPRALLLPPSARALLLLPVPSGAVPSILRPLVPWLTCLGLQQPASALAQALRAAAPHARAVSLGAMQRPPLDGPVDRRTVLERLPKSSVSGRGLL